MSLGDCYEASGKYILDAPEGYLLCHGTVTGTAGEVTGVDYGHAWIEHDDLVIDVANDKTATLPGPLYYKIGNVRDVVRYTRSQARNKIIASEHWGPWHDETKERNT